MIADVLIVEFDLLYYTIDQPRKSYDSLNQAFDWH
jgi:hypothetical protein